MEALESQAVGTSEGQWLTPIDPSSSA